MIERLEAILTERAAQLADHDGVPVARRHVLGAASELAGLLHQARDRVFAAVAPAGGEVQVAPAVTAGAGAEEPASDDAGGVVPAPEAEPAPEPESAPEAPHPEPGP